MLRIRVLSMVVLACVTVFADKVRIDPQTTLECHRREFTFRATRTDNRGRQCWDHITTMSCWGRCDSGEIADWRFPYKRPFHPVCVHEQRHLRTALLRHCDRGTELGLRAYQYYEALSCACEVCDSSTTSCQGAAYDKPTTTTTYA